MFMFKLHTKIFLAYSCTFLVCIGIVLFIVRERITKNFEQQINDAALSVSNSARFAHDKLIQEVRDEVEKETIDPNVLRAVRDNHPIPIDIPLDIIEYVNAEGMIIQSSFSYRRGKFVDEEALARAEAPKPVLKRWNGNRLVLEIILPIEHFGFVRGGYFLKEIEKFIEKPKLGQLFLLEGGKLTPLSGRLLEGAEIEETLHSQPDVKLKSNSENNYFKEVAVHLKEFIPSLAKETYKQGTYKLGKERYSISKIKLWAETPAAIIVAFSHKQLRESQRKFITFLLIVAGIGILAIYGAGYLIARGITRPISQLMASSVAIASGNLDQRVEVKSRDEIGVLANQFNITAQQLKENQEKLLTAERLSTWRSIGRVVAHEMKNPLFPISAAVENLRKSYHANPELFDEIFDECTETVLRQSQKLQKIIDEFHQFARMPKPELKPCNLNDVIDDVLALYAVLPEGIDITKKLCPDMPQILVDSEQLSRACQNIVKNAIEAMPDGGTLTISTEILPSGQIQIKFVDTGVGMSDETQKKLFMPYFTTKEKGTGLGIAIVQQIIVEHDGEIEVNSTEGVGTTFTVTVPLS